MKTLYVCAALLVATPVVAADDYYPADQTMVLECPNMPDKVFLNQEVEVSLNDCYMVLEAGVQICEYLPLVLVGGKILDMVDIRAWVTLRVAI